MTRVSAVVRTSLPRCRGGRSLRRRTARKARGEARYSIVERAFASSRTRVPEPRAARPAPARNAYPQAAANTGHLRSIPVLVERDICLAAVLVRGVRHFA